MNRALTTLALAVGLSASLSGCIGALGDPDAGDGESTGVGFPSAGAGNPSGGDDDDGGTGLDTNPQGDTTPLDHPPVDEGALPRPSAAIRRLSLAQLRASLPVLFGTEEDGVTPITWRMPDGKVGLNVMAGSLGEPDYIEITEENLEPSPMYAKFMDDLARDVCDRALRADVTRPAGATRVLAREADFGDTVASDAAAIDDNVRYLLLRLHAVKAAAGDDELVTPWRAVFAEATADAQDAGLDDDAATAEGWRAVCVGLVVAPEFHLY